MQHSQASCFLGISLYNTTHHTQLVEMRGHDALSQPFHFLLTVHSHIALKPKRLLATPISWWLHQASQQPRYFHGLVAQLSDHGQITRGVYQYQLSIKPWLSLLEQTQDYRVFKQQSVLDIICLLLNELGLDSLDDSALQHQYPNLAYCIQYQESTSAFMQRILSETGIYYYYRHQQHQHTLILLDSNDGLIPANKHRVPIDHWRTIAEYTGQNHQAYQQGRSHDHTLQAGAQSYLTDNRLNATATIQTIIKCRHHAIHASYENHFTTMASNQTFNPTPPKRPDIIGFQAARTVGAPGESIHANSSAHIKAQCHWDRLGKYNHHHAYWFITQQQWCGNGYGKLFIPRVTEAIHVAYYNGNPEQPVALGSFYDGQHTEPYALPKQQRQSGIKNRTLKGPAQQYNELRFDDHNHRQQFYWHAARDFNTTVMHNCHTHVKQQAMTQIQCGDQNITAQQGEQRHQATEIQLQVGATQIIINSSGIYLNSPTIEIKKT